MSKRTLSSQLSTLSGQSVHLSGWVHRIRNFGGLRFLLLRDRDGIAQVVLPKSLDIGEVNCEWVVRIDGTVRAEPRAPRATSGSKETRSAWTSNSGTRPQVRSN